MFSSTFLKTLRGPFSFLRKDLGELSQILPDLARALPTPQRIYLDDEAATPVYGFPVLTTAELGTLEQALEQYLTVEEENQLAILARQPFDPATYAHAWERYRGLVARATENVTASSYGRHFPAIFWLFHSIAVARVLKDSPKRLMRKNAAFAREYGDELRYQVLFKYLDRVAGLTYDIVHRLASDTEEVEEELFPLLFTRMRDNVLVFTEDHISPNLAELAGYFAGYLHIDGRDLRQRLAALADWHAVRLRSDAEMRRAAQLLGAEPDGDARELLTRAGWISYVASRPGYDSRTLLPPRLVQVWESLLIRLKEFELLNCLRRQMLPVERQGEAIVAGDRSLHRLGVPTQHLRLSAATRPLDFMAPWVVDPQVSRFGLIYDISDFSQTISVLRLAGHDDQDRSYRQLFLFQRRVVRLAALHRTKMEKYLGDGAFFSARDARLLLALAIHVQRLYRQAVADGFPFSRGCRIALNFGHYRLLPVQSGQPGEAERYEFFGHGVVELSRLTTGKTTREIDEIKTLLINRGYPEATVNRFFAPLVGDNVDLVDKAEVARGFYSYINENGTLVNEGIVATGAFIGMLAREGACRRFYRTTEGGRTWLGVQLETPGDPLVVGLRKLGNANLKGLDQLPVYEVVDGERWIESTLVEIRVADLLDHLERDFLTTTAGSTIARQR